MIAIRPATPADAGAVEAVLRAAFDGPEEAALLRRLRAEGALLLELVAVEPDGSRDPQAGPDASGGAVTGVIAFSRMTLRFAKTALAAAALAPVAVLPEDQGQGIGSRLIRTGLARLGAMPVIVLGHPGYYPRFGFSAELAERALISPFPGAGRAFMAFDPAGELDGRRDGHPGYAAAFEL